MLIFKFKLKNHIYSIKMLLERLMVYGFITQQNEKKTVNFLNNLLQDLENQVDTAQNQQPGTESANTD